MVVNVYFFCLFVHFVLFFFFFLAQISCSLIKPFCTYYTQMLLSVQKQLSASVWKPAELIVRDVQKGGEYAFSSLTSTPYVS